MKSTNSFTIGKGTISVELLDDRVVVCKVAGVATGPLIAESMRRTKIYTEHALAKGNQASLLIDVSKVTGQDSAARTEAKKLNSFNLSRIAVLGANRAIMAVGKYIVRMGGMGDYTRFFTSAADAEQWAWNGIEKKPHTLRRRQLIGAIGAALIGISVLVGWQYDITLLRSIVPSLRPVNPMVAASVLFVSLGIIAYTKEWRKSAVQSGIIAFAGIWSLLFGVLVLLRSASSIDTSADMLLFGSKMTDTAMGGRASMGAAAMFVCVGIMFCLLLTGQVRRWARDAYYGLSGIVFVATLVNILAYCFGIATADGSRQLWPMALGANLAFIFANYALSGMGRPTPSSIRGNQLVDKYWQALAVTLLMVVLTGFSWQQTRNTLQQAVDAAAKESFNKVEDTINTRLAAYATSLVGYKGLFAASSDVTPKDFADYFKTIDLARQYPGFSAITYIPVVPDDQKGQFIEETRARATESFEKLATFSITPETSVPVHYPITYIQPSTPTTNYGFDLATEAVRRSTLEKARDSNEPVASGMINLNASRGKDAPVNNGFFLSEPIYRNSFDAKNASIAQRREAIRGFALAYFQNDRLFNNALAFANDDNAQYQLTYVQTGQQLYGTAAKNVQANAPVQQQAELSIAGQKWRLDMKISPQFGRNEIYMKLPNTVLVSGLVLAGLAGALVLGQLRRRDQAFALAERMTEDLQNERNLAIENQQKDEAILSSIGDAVFAVDTDQRITLFNPVCERISGWRASEAVGMHYKDVLQFVLGESNKVNDSFVRRALQGHAASMKNQTFLIRRDGQKIAVADSAAPIRNAKGSIIGAIVVFRDVTKEAELDRAKTEFVSLASHQLRTPLSAINWFVEMLQDEDAGKLNDDQKTYVREIYEGNQRMIELVNSLLDVSRLDLGKLTNKPEPTSIPDIITSIRNELQPGIVAKKIDYRLNVRHIPEVVGDPKLLRIIVQNLSSNAVKYTKDGGRATITLRRATEDDMSVARIKADKTGYWYLGVADNGVGIPKAQQAHIFTKLFRADNVRALDVEGNGLGLYLVKQVVEKLGGRIWFTSVENNGTTFSVVLPFKTKHNR